MRSSRPVTYVAVTVLMLAVVALSACAKPASTPTVTSAWPRADAERGVAKPATPPRWPLTGTTAPNVSLIRRRVLSVKVENSPQARPQTGLNMADIVYESLAEGGVTRFNALFHSQDPALIGPVRSARLSDSWIVPQYDALFFFSGASAFVTSALRRVGIAMLSEDVGVTRPFTRLSSRPMPHNLFLKGPLARPEGIKRGYPARQDVKPYAFERRSVASTVTVSQIDIPFSQANRSTWTYDPTRKVYLRQNNGVVHRDAATDQQIRARNVVVMWAQMRAAGARDAAGNPTYDITLGGKNRVSVFHDGRQWDGTWTADKDSAPVFRREDGTVIELAQGNSWFEVIPASVNIALK